jgi:DNA-binding NarL/FixJ family response regulator
VDPQHKLAEKPAEKINILVIEDDVSSQSALRQILDSENWLVHITPLASQALHDLATTMWTLVIANVGMTGLTSPLYTTLRELALSPPMASGKSRLRVLFLVPENAAPQARQTLESQHLPYLLKPFHLHDLLERVGDLLMETAAISSPIRRVRDGLGAARRDIRAPGKAGSGQGAGRNTSMFANYSDYGMTEEEMAEYERQENEETERKKKKKLYPDSF